MTVRMNALNQELDIQGSLNSANTRSLSDETNQLGSQISSGSGDSIGGVAPSMTLTDAGATFTAQDVGRFITIAGATTPANDGVFLIIGYTSGTVITYQNASGTAEVFPGTWKITKPYSLEDDINFARTDRKNIKGTVSHVTDVPTYQRPSAVGTYVPAHLTNIASKTTDAMSLIENRLYNGVTVAAGNTHKEIVSIGNLKHADAVDRRGIPINDGADAGAHLATYVEIINPETEAALEVLGGGDIGKRIFGRTRAGTGAAATGSITTIAKANLVDGEKVVIHDGTSLGSVNYWINQTGTYTPPGGYDTNNIEVDISTDVSADDVRDTFIAAINGSTIAITASNGGAATVSLTNDNNGAQGNQTITETVVDGNFGVSGMSGGAGGFSPNSVDVEFRAVTKGADISTSVAYTWEAGQPTTVNFYYGYRSRLDEITETALRTTLTNGIIGDADLEQDIIDIRNVLGINDGDTSYSGKLTNTGNYYLWSLADANPSAIELFNIINAQIGNRDYTGSYLTDGQTITASLQALSSAISGSSIIRTIERLAAAIPANTSHVLPGGISYTLDGTNNGKNLFVFWRGVLRDPGPITGDNDYEETDTTHITPYTGIGKNDHINYMVLQ